MKADSLSFTRRCEACQLHRNKIHAPTIEVAQFSNSMAFHTWTFDFIRPISPPYQGNIWVLAATECYTKWVEAIALRRATRLVMANSTRDNIFYHFGIPKLILSDNGMPFINSHVRYVNNKDSIMSSRHLTILKRMAKPKPLIKLYLKC